jgi:hypothetical protein
LPGYRRDALSRVSRYERACKPFDFATVYSLLAPDARWIKDSSDAFSLQALKAANSAKAKTARMTPLFIDVASPVRSLSGNDDVANGQENHGADREPHTSRNHRIRVAAVHNRVDDSQDYRKQIEPEVQLARASRGPAGGDPHLGQVDQARNNREQKAKDDQPRGPPAR